MDYNKELIIAAESGNLETVQNCITNGADVNFMGPNSSALHCAAFNGHNEIVKVLLENDANVNVTDNQEFYPLQLAVSKENLTVCKTLIEHGADVLVKTDKQGTLLHLAAAIDFNYIFKIEEIKEIDLEAKDIYGQTPLNVAASSGSYSMIGDLLRMKADINTSDNYGASPLLNSIMHMDNTKVREWESIGENDGVPVKYKITNGWMQYIKPYTGNVNDSSTDIEMWEQDEISEYAWTPDGLKKYVNAERCISLYTNRSNLDRNHVDNAGNSAVLHACSLGEPEIIEDLFSNKFPFDIKNEQGIHCLHYLARSKRLDGLKSYFKINKDADPNVVDNNGWTPAHYLADQGGHPDMAKILVEKGLDINIGSTKVFASFDKNTKASDVAKHWNDAEMVRLLS
ncbi:ankyrin repeat domain-containing protein [uncultured Kordia sp.]|uniref:ankyrin repeat domain-containing protein n=1 Tax=uncultured Kordia sp. TaxID=507699 RepID=UPI002622B507|nr:ankyrin repeat domain-containing protein [uncultured Kordia sp.]